MGHPEGDDRDAAWNREALRLHRRYQIEIVEACGLCPWAEGARLGGKVRERIVLGEAKGAVLEGSLGALAELARDRDVEVGFLVYPRFAVTRFGLEAFAAELRTADGARYEIGRVPFVFAAFHPDAEPDTGDPERLIPFLRRTPDPTLQLVRASVLDSVRSLSSQGTQFVSLSALEQMKSGQVPGVPLRERIARTNLATVKRMGVDAMRAALDDIRRDREETYGRLA
ncbi:MAG: DUF1415 family protein [Polyangiaceae bacterium]